MSERERERKIFCNHHLKVEELRMNGWRERERKKKAIEVEKIVHVVVIINVRVDDCAFASKNEE